MKTKKTQKIYKIISKPLNMGEGMQGCLNEFKLKRSSTWNNHIHICKLLYWEPLGNHNQKSMLDTNQKKRERERNGSKHNTRNSHLKGREQQKKTGTKQNCKNSPPKMNKMAVSTAVQFSRSVVSDSLRPQNCSSLSITNFRSSPKLTSIESVMPSSHLILCRPLLLLPRIPPSIRVFSNESTLHMR